MKPFVGFGVYNAMRSPTCGCFSVLLCLGLLLAFAGCTSEEREATSPGRHRRPPPTPLAGQGEYFDGRISVAITVGALEAPGLVPGAREGGEKSGGERRHAGGM